jgi:hypothetical protein
MFTVSFAIAYRALDWRGLRCDLEFAEHTKDTQNETFLEASQSCLMCNAFQDEKGLLIQR